MDLKRELESSARALGFDLCGVTSADAPPHALAFQRWLAAGHHGEMGYMARGIERRLDLQLALPGVRSVVVAGMNYQPAQDAGIAVDGRSNEGASSRPDPARPGRAPLRPRGVVARYARGIDYHAVMGKKLDILARKVRELGGPATETKCYVDTGPVLERDLAQRAGIGWIGKHTSLISRHLGNWFFLGELLTTLEIEPGTPEREYCGSCTRCIAACPTAAIRAPYVLDARRCISYLTIELKGPIPVEFRPLVGNRIFGCDDCLAVCPWNRFAKAAKELRPAGGEEVSSEAIAYPDLTDWMGLTEGQFRARFRGTSIERIKRRGLLRNVAVALGNSRDRRALPALENALQDPEPLVREHAAWARERIEAGR